MITRIFAARSLRVRLQCLFSLRTVSASDFFFRYPEVVCVLYVACMHLKIILFLSVFLQISAFASNTVDPHYVNQADGHKTVRFAGACEKSKKFYSSSNLALVTKGNSQGINAVKLEFSNPTCATVNENCDCACSVDAEAVLFPSQESKSISLLLCLKAGLQK